MDRYNSESRERVTSGNGPIGQWDSMDELSAFTPEQQEQILALMSRNNATGAKVKIATAIPSRGTLIGRVGSFSAWLANNVTGAVGVLLLQSDLNQVKTEWMPRVVAVGDAIATGLDSLAYDSNDQRQFASLPTPLPVDAIGSGHAEFGFKAAGSGNIVVTPGTAELRLTTYAPIVTTTTTPAPNGSSDGGAWLAGTTTISFGTHGTRG